MSNMIYKIISAPWVARARRERSEGGSREDGLSRVVTGCRKGGGDDEYSSSIAPGVVAKCEEKVQAKA
jgi:hypothetical protein